MPCRPRLFLGSGQRRMTIVDRLLRGGGKDSIKGHVSRSTRKRILACVQKYGGIPLSRQEVQDELGLSVATVSLTLADYARKGVIGVKVDPEMRSRALYYAKSTKL